jgi:hypothetical protein
LVVLTFLVSACGGSSKNSEDVAINTAPEISSIYTDIIHYHPSFWEKWNIAPARGIQITFSFRVDDSDGLSDIDDIYVRNYVNGNEYDIYSGPNNVPLEKFYNSRLNTFEGSFFTYGSLDRVDLRNWKVVASDKSGNITEREFEFSLPNEELASDSDYVYSDQYSSPGYNGVAAMEAMTISDNNLSLVSNAGTQSFNIKFQTNDDRASHYSIAFYGSAPNYQYLGWANQVSPSIVSTSIVTGEQISLDLPWSEIYFIDDAQPIDVNGVHVTLYNEPIENDLIENYIWYSFLAYSEYFTLEPK